MNVLSKEEFKLNFEDLSFAVEDGAIFIHPTDTIYGIGCDATIKEAVRKVRDLKDRHEAPFSVIVPSKEWIYENCEINEKAGEWVDKLPGPYTLIVKLKNKGCIAANVNFGLDTIGVRLPDHWFSEYVAKLNRPIISTSANKSGQNFMTSVEDLDEELSREMHFAIYEDKKVARPSHIVDLTKSELTIKKR